MSMISPKTAVEELKNKTYEELLEERDEYLEYVREFEAHRDEPIAHDIYPTPETRYQWDLEYLGELFKLIAEKYNEESIWEK